MTIFQKRTTPQRIVFAVVFVIFSLYALSLLYPFIWAFYNSMKTMDEYRDNTFSLPDRFNLTNYAEAFRSFKISTSGGAGSYVSKQYPAHFADYLFGRDRFLLRGLCDFEI